MSAVACRRLDAERDASSSTRYEEAALLYRHEWDTQQKSPACKALRDPSKAGQQSCAIRGSKPRSVSSSHIAGRRTALPGDGQRPCSWAARPSRRLRRQKRTLRKPAWVACHIVSYCHVGGSTRCSRMHLWPFKNAASKMQPFHFDNL